MFNSDNLRLDGKCAIITGAGAGIGKEIAITFATAGASVVVSDINADAANHVVDEIQQLDGQAFAWRCDITSEQELSALADFAVSNLGKVDILVNNAGGVVLNRLICQWQIFAVLMN
ncbi:7-alpha-hydroxysteroid dehydrogenase [Shigella flexneri 1235-66]|nr:7-alpha-hydroxysteroid dehydrogenase [Shigella flexneri 1235-66]